MRTRVELLGTVMQCITQYLGGDVPNLHRHSQLEDDYGLDSTEMVCIAVDLEKALSLSLKGIAFGGLKTPEHIVDAVLALHPMLTRTATVVAEPA